MLKHVAPAAVADMFMKSLAFELVSLQIQCFRSYACACRYMSLCISVWTLGTWMFHVFAVCDCHSLVICLILVFFSLHSVSVMASLPDSSAYFESRAKEYEVPAADLLAVSRFESCRHSNHGSLSICVE